eukprot:4147542-Alexandrium_andersonii.AAC.1
MVAEEAAEEESTIEVADPEVDEVDALLAGQADEGEDVLDETESLEVLAAWRAQSGNWKATRDMINRERKDRGFTRTPLESVRKRTKCFNCGK